MMTLKQIERGWRTGSYGRLMDGLRAGRPEAEVLGGVALARAVPAAALAVVRLEELSLAHVPLVGELVRVLLAAQEPDGGWGDAVTTALAVRALACGRGAGPAIDAGVAYLGSLQRADGLWPTEPIRRMPGCLATTAAVVLLVGELPAFRQGCNLSALRRRRVEGAAMPLWDRALARLPRVPAGAEIRDPVFAWG